MKQVPPDKGEFKAFGRVPAQPDIEFGIARYRSDRWSIVIVQHVDPTQLRIKFQIR